MQNVALPPKIIQGIDKLNKNFIWGSLENKKKIHLIGWRKITKAKEEGRVGIHAAKPKNTALLAKLNLKFHAEKSSLWVRVLTNKYRRQGNNPRSISSYSSCSPTWAGLKKGVDIFSKGSKWLVGKNSILSLWFDKWLNIGTLRSLISGPLNKGEDNLMLKDISGFFGWNWEGLSFEFPAQIQLEIKATPLPFSNQGGDRLFWYSSPNGDFKLKEAYRLANWDDNNKVGHTFRGEWVWKVQYLPKIKFFLWKCYHHSLSIQTVMSKRGMDIPFLCPMCNNAPETILHTLRDCPQHKCFGIH